MGEQGLAMADGQGRHHPHAPLHQRHPPLATHSPALKSQSSRTLQQLVLLDGTITPPPPAAAGAGGGAAPYEREAGREAAHRWW